MATFLAPAVVKKSSIVVGKSSHQSRSKNDFHRIKESRVFAVWISSVSYDVLQEAVGVVVVVPLERTRPDIRQLNEALQSYLTRPKPLMLVVYMDGVPKSSNKIQRQRPQVAVAALTDSTLPADRHYEADCPPANTPLTEMIPSKKCVDPASILHVLRSACASVRDILMRRNKADGFLQAILFFRGQQTVSSDDLIAYLRSERHGYLVPSSVKSLDGRLPLDDEGRAIEGLIDEAIRKQIPNEGLSAVQKCVCELFGCALGRQLDNIDSSTDFFAAGGDGLVLAVWYPSCAENSRSTFLMAFCSITALWVLKNPKFHEPFRVPSSFDSHPSCIPYETRPAMSTLCQCDGPNIILFPTAHAPYRSTYSYCDHRGWGSSGRPAGCLLVGILCGL